MRLISNQSNSSQIRESLRPNAMFKVKILNLGFLVKPILILPLKYFKEEKLGMNFKEKIKSFSLSS